MTPTLTPAGVGALFAPPVLFEVWTLDAAGDWHRAGTYGSRAEAETAVPDRGRAPGWIVLAVGTGFAQARRTATNATDDQKGNR